LGTSGAPASIIDLVYSYGTTNNNGNVQSIAYNGGGLSYTQTFGYDALNRLTTAQENSGANWSQTNGYDRYGNRWIDLGGGNQSLYFTTSNNRITGASYDNAGNLLNDGYHSYAYDAENKISKVDGTSAYVYDGNGERVRKLIGENLRFIYGLSGQLIAEYSGSTGALTKEYIYGPNGLVATIEPTTINSNGTRYTTSDHLGSPRVISNSSAGVVSRHDYMPFGEEIGSGVGGRTVGSGFGVAEGLRKKFTSHERDAETGLDYMQARYYSSGQGRFSSPDPLLASGESRNPQSWNRYAYVLNNPVRLIDPNGLDDAEPADSQDKKQVVNPLEDKVINKRLAEIRDKAKPLAAGETPRPTTVEVIQGEQTVLQNATIDVPEPDQDMEIDNGYMQNIALVVLDQGGNIMVDPNLSVTETVTADNKDAKDLFEANKVKTTNTIAISQQANGAFYDVQARQFDPNKQLMDVQTKQDAVIKSGTTNLFMVQGTQIRMNDASKSITYKQGPVRKFGN